MTLVSLVIPLYNEEACLPELVKQIDLALEPLGVAYEMVFVDDSSKDKTPQLIDELSRTRKDVLGFRLSRNSGHQAALTCGLEAATGDVVITMDGDLQHPPSEIPKLLALWNDGYDIVNTVRNQTEASGFLDKLASHWFYRVFNRVADIKLIPGSADFRLLDRKAVDALNSMREVLKFYRGQVPYIGFKQTTHAFDCPPRFAGTRAYTFRQSLKLASNGLFSFSSFGLKVPIIVGLVALAAVALYFLLSLVLIVTGKTHLQSGWLSLAALITLSIGLQLTFLGTLGLYIGKIFIEVKGRPLYFVEKTFGRVSARAEADRVPLKGRREVEIQ